MGRPWIVVIEKRRDLSQDQNKFVRRVNGNQRGNKNKARWSFWKKLGSRRNDLGHLAYINHHISQKLYKGPPETFPIKSDNYYLRRNFLFLSILRRLNKYRHSNCRKFIQNQPLTKFGMIKILNWQINYFSV